MKITKEELNNVGLTMAAFASSFLLKKILEEGYRKVYDEEPPNAADDRDVNWGRVMGWTIISGVTATALKIAVKRLGAQKLPVDES